MELTDSNREVVRTTAAALVTSYRRNDHQHVARLAGGLVARHGPGGLAYLLVVLAEEVTAFTPPEARTPFGKVDPATSLTPDEYQLIAARATAHRPAGVGVSDRATILRHVADYLNAVLPPASGRRGGIP